MQGTTIKTDQDQDPHVRCAGMSVTLLLLHSRKAESGRAVKSPELVGQQNLKFGAPMPEKSGV
jgi:hypothetical protein